MKYKTKAKIDRFIGGTILFLVLLGAMGGLVAILISVLEKLR
jgi:hypothetical protein